MGLLWTPLAFLLLLLREPACLRTQDHPSRPEPRELEASKIVLLPSCLGAPGSPEEKGAPGQGQPGLPGKMGPKSEPGIWELWVELEDFHSNHIFAHYGCFHLLGEVDHYQLVLGKFSEGSAGDSLSYHSGKSFTTYDADHDISGSNCAVNVHGAWWYGSCYQYNLNGRYAMSPTTAHKYGIDWASGFSMGHPYCRVCMMLR